MTDETETIGRSTARANRTIMIACLAFVVSMVGMAYAAVPVYQLFCQATGYGGATRRVADNGSKVLDRQLTVRFDANTHGSVPLDFTPVQSDVVVRIGETVTIAYRATNRSSEPVAAQALFNVTPTVAGAYFNKIDCFCFTETRLEPGETKELPVVFFIDPAYVTAKELKDIRTLTLSYTYFAAADSEPQKAGKSRI